MSAPLERLARACILPGFAGETAPVWLLRELEAGLGGVVLFARNVVRPELVPALTASLRVRSDVIVAIDEEGGDVTRLEAERGSSTPGALALGVVDDVRLTEEVARATGAALRNVGITHDLAPVADVNTNPRNPVIGVRSFGSEPELVARHVAASVAGLQTEGVAACVKHFPGHGDTAVDSHLGLPVVEVTRERLEQVELVPFRAAVAAGACSLMTAHIVVPVLDDRPATLSHAVLTGLLREELGYDGMVVTDALEMGAISSLLGMGEAGVQSLLAGADALCLGHDIDDSHVDEVRTAIVAAVRSGRLPLERLEQAAARVAGSHAVVPPSSKAPPLHEIGLVAARRAVGAEGDVAVSGPLLVVELEGTTSVAAGPLAHGLAGVLREHGADVDVARVGEDDAGKLSPVTGRVPVVVVHDVERHPWQRDVAARIAAAHPDAVVVDVGYPDTDPHPALRRRIVTHGAARANLDAAAERMLVRR